MKYCGVIETMYKGQAIKERSEFFNNPMQSEAWLSNCLREAKALKVKVLDHYLVKEDN